QPINGCSSDSDCVIQGTRCFAGTCFDVDCGNGGDPVSLVGCSIKGGGGTCQTCDGVTCDTICGCPTGQQCFANRCVVNGGCGRACAARPRSPRHAGAHHGGASASPHLPDHSAAHDRHRGGGGTTPSA